MRLEPRLRPALVPMHVHSPGDLLDAARKLCTESEEALHAKVGRHPSSVCHSATACEPRDHPFTPVDEVRWRCFDATYSARLLMDGYGVPQRAPVVEFVDEIDGMDADWQLGALISRLLNAHYGTKGAGSVQGEADQDGSMRIPLPAAH